MPEQKFTVRLAKTVELSGSVSKLARLAGVSSRMLGKYLSGESDPSRARLISIAQSAGVAVLWLATGEGPMRMGDLDEPVACGGASNLDPGEYNLVSRYNVEVSAGHGCWPECEEVIEKMAFRRSWLQRLGLQVKSLVLVTARGDSMEPTFYDGDLLLVDLAQVKVVDGGISVIRNDGLLLAKRLQAGLGEKVYVCSDNQRYQRLETIKENLNIVGRVVWRGGKL